MRNFNSAVNLQVKCELPLTMGGFQMAIEIGAVQSVSMMSGDPGWGFHLRDCTGRHWILARSLACWRARLLRCRHNMVP